MIAAARGYKFIAVVDDHCAPEKITTIKAFGGSVVAIKSSQKGLPSPNEREDTAHRLAQEIAGAYWTNQADNLEILEATNRLRMSFLSRFPV